MVVGVGRPAVALLFVVVAMAGCASEPEQLDSEEGGTLKTDVVEDEKPVAEDVGRVRGVVLHASGFPLPGARITIMSVDSSVTTDAQGAFAFESVPIGTQQLRVEKETYQTLQRVFDVVGGKVTQLEIVLVPAKGAEGGFSEHFHDHWRGSKTYAVYDGTLAFGTDIGAIPPKTCGGVPYVGGITPYDPGCYYLYIYPKENRIVPPGTEKVDVKISFEPGALFEEETMYFYMYPPTDSEGNYYYAYQAIESGETEFEFELPVSDIVDNGHARWTNWRFYIYWYPASPYVAGDWYNEMFRSPVDVTITAHKGNLSLDPPHPRFWAESDEISMGVSEPSSVYCSTVQQYSCGYRYPEPSVYSYSGKTYCYYGCMTLKAGSIVPPGTKRVEFNVEHTSYQGTLSAARGLFEEDEWVFGFKSAAAPKFNTTWEHYTWLEPEEVYETAAGTGYRFAVDVQDDMTDTFYTTVTSWIVAVAIKGDESAPTYAGMSCRSEVCGSQSFALLDFTAYNDDREAMIEEGNA